MPNKTRISKRVRAIMGVGLLAFVMTIGLTVVQPKPTKAAVCETPVTAVASVGLWLANSFGFLGDFGSTISDFLIADVETGQDEIQTRIEDTDENIRIGMSEWWNEDMLPAMKDGEKQLGAMRQTETMQRGMAIDMQEEARRQREIGDATADAAIGADYTDMSCQADTIAAGGIAADNPSKPGSCRFEGSIFSNRQKTGIYNNQCANGETTKFYYECCNGTIETRQTQICGERQTSVPNCQGGTTDVPESTSNGGIGYSAKISDEIARGSSVEAAARSTAEEGTPEAQGPAAVLADKWSNMTSAYCDPEANGGNMPCQTTNPEMVGKNIEMGSSLLWGEKLTIDMNREQNQKLFEDAMRTFVDQNPPQPIPEDILGNQRAIYQFNMTRANAARKNAVHSVMAQMMADRASRPANDALPSAQEIRTAAGLPASETTDLPSMNEITQALFQDRFTRPEFIAMVTKTPEELIKNNLDVSTGHLVQWNMMYKRLERLSVLYASEFARDLEYSEPDFVGDVPVSGVVGPDRDRTPVDPETFDEEEVEECSIIDFEIPDNPFGCPNQVADLTLSGMEGEFITPVRGYAINSEFGHRHSPGGIGSRNHKGIDIAAPTGTPIYASMGGTVIASNYSSSYGNLVYIDHGNGVVTRYAHMNTQSPFSVGQRVEQGQQIGAVGSTGNSTGPHLHFEIRVNGTAVDPMRYLADVDAASDEHDDHDDHEGEGLSDYDIACGGATGIAFDCSSPEGQTPRDPSSMAISDQYIQNVMQEEGFRNRPYRDQAGLWTIGVGHLIRPGENFTFLDDNEVMDLFRRDNAVAEADVKRCVTAPLTQNQYEALVSLSFNLGGPKFCNSQLVRKLNQGDYEGAMNEFGRWNKVTQNGRLVVSRGLTNRRAREAALFGACQ